MSGGVLWAVLLAFLSGGNFIGGFVFWSCDEHASAILLFGIAAYCLLCAFADGASA